MILAVLSKTVYGTTALTYCVHGFGHDWFARVFYYPNARTRIEYNGQPDNATGYTVPMSPPLYVGFCRGNLTVVSD